MQILSKLKNDVNEQPKVHGFHLLRGEIILVDAILLELMVMI